MTPAEREATHVRRYLALVLAITCVTAWGSYAYFHIDEYFQIIEWTRFKLGQVELWMLPWEHGEQMRSWMQPALYWLVARMAGALGASDPFTLAFLFRLLTGIANVGALALFLRTTLPWLDTETERRAQVRAALFVGFLPYLFVRTSSESASMAALTIAFAILLDGARVDPTRARWSAPALASPRAALFAGALFGLAFELRFQTAAIALGTLAWLAVMARVSVRSLGLVMLGGAFVVVAGVFIDHWGYGAWTFPAWTYFEANVLAGAAATFGTEPPFAYLWLLPANLFAPILLVSMLLGAIAFYRCPRHPLTWATLPFVLLHNLIAHKEERFLYPIAIFATAFVTMALAPSAGRPLAVSTWGWARRDRAPVKALVALNVATMAFLAVWPLGWHHHVRFARWVHDHIGEELRANALPDVDLGLPAFHPRIYALEKADPDEIARRVDEGIARDWLIADDPTLHAVAPSLEPRATLVFTELPTPRLQPLVDAYNARAHAPLRPLRFRSIYRLHKSAPH